MEVTIKIPQYTIGICKECGFDEEQTKEIFLYYLTQTISDDYRHFIFEFSKWVKNIDVSELNKIFRI